MRYYDDCCKPRHCDPDCGPDYHEMMGRMEAMMDKKCADLYEHMCEYVHHAMKRCMDHCCRPMPMPRPKPVHRPVCPPPKMPKCEMPYMEMPAMEMPHMEMPPLPRPKEKPKSYYKPGPQDYKGARG